MEKGEGGDAVFSLDGKVAVVTGAASGLGRATALRFARAGAKVVLADVADASEVAGEAGGVYVKTDVSREEQVKDLMQAALSEYGKLTTVVNNAGIAGGMTAGPSLGAIGPLYEKIFSKALDIEDFKAER